MTTKEKEVHQFFGDLQELKGDILVRDRYGPALTDQELDAVELLADELNRLIGNQ